ncbi:MAG: LLM class F420-dependent oxidoreductase [Acidimicrobiia bacterium]
MSTELHIMVEPQQGTSYEQLRRLATHAESLGFAGFFSSDHYLVMGSKNPLPGPLDTWTTLAGLARDTTTLRLGPLITPATFRLPGPLAIAVAQVDAMSGGRIEFSLGAGWYEAEHKAYGIAFPSNRERLDMLEEQLAIILGLWRTKDGETFSFHGKHYDLTDSPALPKPMQRPNPPVIIGGGGPKRTPRIAARWADEFNLPFAPLNAYVAQCDRVRAACEAIGRDPASMRFSAALCLCAGANTAEFERRAAAIGREPDEIRLNGAAGSVAETIDKINTFVSAGAERVYLQVLDVDDLDHLSLVAAEIMPAL